MRGWVFVAAGIFAVVQAFGSGSADAARTRTPPAPLPPPQEVDFTGDYAAGSIVIVNAERALYYIVGEGKARRYPVAIGTRDEQWTGREVVTAKKENPTWYPISDDDGDRRPPVPGGHPKNPLGVRALYLGKTLWRIHGTIAPSSIGKAASNGCIRMHNEHVVDLYDRVAVGSGVYVVRTLAEAPPQKKGRKLFG